MNPLMIHNQNVAVLIAMSIAELQYLSYSDKYVDNVNECFKKYSDYSEYIDLIRRIRTNCFDIMDPRCVRDSFAHNSGINEGYYECDDKKVSTWALIAFSDVISTIGEMSMFIIRMKACLNLFSRPLSN